MFLGEIEQSVSLGRRHASPDAVSLFFLKRVEKTIVEHRTRRANMLGHTCGYGVQRISVGVPDIRVIVSTGSLRTPGDKLVAGHSFIDRSLRMEMYSSSSTFCEG